MANSTSTKGATITLKGNPIHTVGNLPKKGTNSPDFTLTNASLEEKSLSDFKGSNLILNIFPSIDTPVCAESVRAFNKKAADLKNTKVLCISEDLPFAQKRFCGAENIEDVITLSSFRNDFGEVYGVKMADGAMKDLLSRAVVILDTEGKVIYTEQVSEIAEEPDYAAALEALN